MKRRSVRPYQFPQPDPIFWPLERFGGIEPEDLQTERATGWEERLTELAQVSGVDLAGLPPTKSAREKVLLAAAMKRRTSASNGWLAHRLGMGQPNSVSQFVRRWELDAARRSEVLALLSRVTL